MRAIAESLSNTRRLALIALATVTLVFVGAHVEPWLLKLPASVAIYLLMLHVNGGLD